MEHISHNKVCCVNFTSTEVELPFNLEVEIRLLFEFMTGSGTCRCSVCLPMLAKDPASRLQFFVEVEPHRQPVTDKYIGYRLIFNSYGFGLCQMKTY